MLPDEEIKKRLETELRPELEKAGRAISDFGLACLRVGIEIVKEVERSRNKLAHPDSEKNRSL